MRLTIVAGADADGARVEVLSDAVTLGGAEVAVVSPDDAGRPEVVLSVGAQAHERAAALGSDGIVWVADNSPGSGPDAVAAADAVTVASSGAQARLQRHGVPSAVVADAGEAPVLVALARRLRGWRRPPSALRVLLVGPVNTVHFEHAVEALLRAGVDVVPAGVVTPTPVTRMLDAGVPVVTPCGSHVRWLRELARRVQPTIVHAHWMPYAAKALLAGVRPVVAQPWGSDVYRAALRFRLANGAVMRFADHVVADSADLAGAARRLGARPSRVSVINWGVDLGTFAPTDEPRWAIRRRLGLEDGPLVLGPRALGPHYNPEVLVRAFASVRESVPDLQLVLKHPGSASDAERRRLEPLPTGARLVGDVEYDQLADWYRAAEVCVSIPDTDSSPRSVWEAMACGTPCLVSDLPWVREAIRPGVEAVTTPVGPEAVADALRRLLADAELRARLSVAGRELVARFRDRERETARLVELYERMTSSS